MFVHIYHSDEGMNGVVSKSDLEAAPKDLQEVLSKVNIEREDGDNLYFSVEKKEDADYIVERISRYSRNKSRSQARSSAASWCSGTYEDGDIERLFEAQKGQCYYTGEPLTNSPKNWAIDHVVPVADFGSFWPSNLVLALRSANQEKRHLSKKAYFSVLEKRLGKEWRNEQRAFCRSVDAKRKRIDRDRREAISEQIAAMEEQLKKAFPKVEIDYSLIGNGIDLCINSATVELPGDYIRRKAIFNSYEYLRGIVMAILGTAR